MVPKSARFALFAALLASNHAHGAPQRAAAEPHASKACGGGRIVTAAATVAFTGCRTITGDLTIEGTDLSDLSALAELRSVSGALTIRENAKLRSLDGLEQLERVGSLNLTANGLYGTHGIEALRQVGTLVIASNRLLISLYGFRNVERVGKLVVRDNPRVSAHFGLFQALGPVEHGLTVVSNRGLSRDEIASFVARTGGGTP